ncbi:MAG: globin [Alphaproteobacteria bacterium HGW-Alphaproteobacteria-18]|nr:MAG: globin [Alphaproteobacteria bacterium HGW-Alphaproteobacteria-18]
MTEFRVRSAEERREELRAQAAEMGIDEAFISTLVDTFYTNVRAHPVLGPVFETAISDWTPHLETMKNFWSSVALGTGRYSGRPVPAHFKHRHIQQVHFNLWLALFEQTLRETTSSPAAIPFFMDRAGRIAQSLQYALFGLEDLPLNRPG